MGCYSVDVTGCNLHGAEVQGDGPVWVWVEIQPAVHRAQQTRFAGLALGPSVHSQVREHSKPEGTCWYVQDCSGKHNTLTIRQMKSLRNKGINFQSDSVDFPISHL